MRKVFIIGGIAVAVIALIIFYNMTSKAILSMLLQRLKKGPSK